MAAGNSHGPFLLRSRGRLQGNARPARRVPRDRRVTSIEVSEAQGVRHLHFGSHLVQGAMRIARPLSLELEYTREMMLPLLLHPGDRVAAQRPAGRPRVRVLHALPAPPPARGESDRRGAPARSRVRRAPVLQAAGGVGAAAHRDRRRPRLARAHRRGASTSSSSTASTPRGAPACWSRSRSTSMPAAASRPAAALAANLLTRHRSVAPVVARLREAFDGAGAGAAALRGRKHRRGGVERPRDPPRARGPARGRREAQGRDGAGPGAHPEGAPGRLNLRGSCARTNPRRPALASISAARPARGRLRSTPRSRRDPPIRIKRSSP